MKPKIEMGYNILVSLLVSVLALFRQLDLSKLNCLFGILWSIPCNISFVI